ncbi:MAG: CarD family transcriptional regulator [Clostridia bacterium]|nr:CarD family transcriptional regulator [Clostridia bacterium]
MLKLNEKVMYGTTGVCVVEKIEDKKIGREVKRYYVLKPVTQSSSTVFLPADNEKLLSKARDVLTKKQICGIVEELKLTDDVWVDSDNDRRLKFSEMISSGDCKVCMLLLRSLLNRQTELLEKGKRLHLADERALKETQRLTFDEIAEAFGVSLDEAEAYFKMELLDN